MICWFHYLKLKQDYILHYNEDIKIMTSVLDVTISSEILKRHFAKELNSIIFELSDLSAMNIPLCATREDIIITNKETKNTCRFTYTHADTDATQEDVYGWNYIGDNGVTLLLIND